MTISVSTDVIGQIKDKDALIIKPFVAGYTPAEYDIITKQEGYTDEGGSYGSERSAWVLAGVSGSNTESSVDQSVRNETMATVLYGKITGTTSYVLKLYKDAAFGSGDEVATGTVTRATGGTLTLTAVNGSGLTGTLTVAAGATNDEFIIVVENYFNKYDGNAAKAIVGILELWADEDNGIGNIILAANNVMINKLGKSNVDDSFKMETLIDALRLKNIIGR